jgi:hypothetical protein
MTGKLSNILIYENPARSHLRLGYCVPAYRCSAGPEYPEFFFHKVNKINQKSKYLKKIYKGYNIKTAFLRHGVSNIGG